MIEVISTFAKDEVVNNDTGVQATIDGGPALWIQKTLQDLGTEFHITSAHSPAKTHIEIDDGEEIGKIIELPNIAVEKIPSVADLYLVSTVGNEFDLKSLEKTQGLVSIDAQGYARTDSFDLPAEIWDKITIVKANEAEVQRLPQDFIKSQSSRILLITKADAGCDLFENNHLHHLEAEKINHLKDTIGAGDTLLAAFCSKYLDSQDSYASLSTAMKYVAKFLKSKL